MNDHTLDTLRLAYGWNDVKLSVINSGLINSTWKATAAARAYVLQQVNTHVFKRPDKIDENLERLASYLGEKAPGYLFTAPVKTKKGKGLVQIDDTYYRVFEWVNGSHTISVVENTGQAFEAASQFGRFTALLEGFDAHTLHITLPGFHNLNLRYHQFENALRNGNKERMQGSAHTIEDLQSQLSILARYNSFISHPEARIRVTHHDTKISNVLFNEEEKGICVIDLDTVMPGYFLSDVGDMLRTYVCPVSEEEKNLERVVVRKEFIIAIREGYLSAMGEKLSSFEKDHFYFAGEMLIYMQALRFMTDYLNNDAYYGSSYPGQNGVRACNQVMLLAAFQKEV